MEGIILPQSFALTQCCGSGGRPAGDADQAARGAPARLTQPLLFRGCDPGAVRVKTRLGAEQRGRVFEIFLSKQ